MEKAKDPSEDCHHCIPFDEVTARNATNQVVSSLISLDDAISLADSETKPASNEKQFFFLILINQFLLIMEKEVFKVFVFLTSKKSEIIKLHF